MNYRRTGFEVKTSVFTLWCENRDFASSAP
jgi:hypothetical protein